MNGDVELQSEELSEVQGGVPKKKNAQKILGIQKICYWWKVTCYLYRDINWWIIPKVLCMYLIIFERKKFRFEIGAANEGDKDTYPDEWKESWWIWEQKMNIHKDS